MSPERSRAAQASSARTQAIIFLFVGITLFAFTWWTLRDDLTGVTVLVLVLLAVGDLAIAAFLFARAHRLTRPSDLDTER